jgi:hypothetical protein
MTSDVAIAVAGTLAGGLISLGSSLLTLRSTHRSERQKWLDDHHWEFSTDLRAQRRKAYSKLLASQNAIIMSAGALRNLQQGKEPLTGMPPDQATVYEANQDAYSVAMLLAGPTVLDAIIEMQNELDQLVWASWKGKIYDQSGDLFGNQLDSMKIEVVEQPDYGSQGQDAGQPDAARL